MLLHCTQALAKKLKQTSSATLVSQSEWQVWHAHLLRIKRRQCVLFCHDQTRYMLLLPGARAEHFADLRRWHCELFRASLVACGSTNASTEQAELALGPLAIDTKTDRSVLGSMRIAAQDLEFGFLRDIPNVLDVDPVALAQWLNHRPVTVYGKWLWPDEAMCASLSP